MYIKDFMVIELYSPLLKHFVSFSNLFDSQRVGTPITVEWTGVPVLCCHGKSSSYIPTSEVHVIRSCSFGYF